MKQSGISIAAILLTAWLSGTSFSCHAATTAYGVTATNNLVRFNAATPGTFVSSTPITGLQSGEFIAAIDFRPENSKLYGLGTTRRLYVIDVVTGAATAVSDTALTFTGTDIGFDFDPTVDLIRITSDADENQRIVPDAATATVDTNLNPGTPNVTASAYTNSFAGSTSTTLYGIDTGTDQLVIQNPPNAGTLTNVGGLGVDALLGAAFDIEAGTNTAFAILNTGFPVTLNQLYTINLTTGAATLIGTTASPLTSLAIAPQGFTASLVGTTATFTGTPAADQITFDASGGLLRHNRFSLGDADFSSDFDFDTGTAGDQTLSATDPMVEIVVNTGDRDDVITLGSSAFAISGVAGTFTIDGQGGADELVVSDTAASVAKTVNIFSSSILGIISGLDYSGMELIRLNGGSGADVVNVQSTSAMTILNTGDGNDTVKLIDFATLNGGYIDGGTGTNLLDYTNFGASASFSATEMNTVFVAKISGQQEPSPVSNSQASGFGGFVLNQAQTALTFSTTYMNLTGTTLSGAHFHNAPLGVNGSIVRGLTSAEQNGALVPDGAFFGTWSSGDSEPLTAALVTELLAGRIYTNIHTDIFTSGEIRGQLFSEGIVGRATGTSGVRNIGVVNTAPVFTSGPAFAPNPTSAGIVTSFFAAASDSEALTYTWNFGDGGTGTGSTTFHTFAAAGTFNVTVTATDTLGGATTANLSVTVGAGVGGTITDTDGDGFTDAIETVAGTSPTSAASTPINNLPAPAALPLPDVKLAIKLSFAKQNSDSISMSGSLLLSEGFDIASKTMLVQIGDLAGAFTLDAKGVAKTDAGTVSVKSKGTAARIAKFSIKLTKGNFSSALLSSGFTNETITKDVNVPLTVIIDGKIFQKVQAQTYKASLGKGASSKDKKR